MACARFFKTTSGAFHFGLHCVICISRDLMLLFISSEMTVSRTTLKRLSISAAERDSMLLRNIVKVIVMVVDASEYPFRRLTKPKLLQMCSQMCLKRAMIMVVVSFETLHARKFRCCLYRQRRHETLFFTVICLWSPEHELPSPKLKPQKQE